MHNRFANPRGVLAEVLDMRAEDIPADWLKDIKILGLLTEYYSPSLKILEELADPNRNTIHGMNAIGTTLDKQEYGAKIRARITRLQESKKKSPLQKLCFWKKNI